MFIKHLLLSLLILCVTTLAYGKDTKADNVHYANDGSNTAIITNTLADIDNLSGLSPLDIIKNPNLLDDKWDLKPIPLSAYTEEEKQLQQLINDKTTTAVKTYSTPEQSKEWTKYDHEEITPYTWKIVELALTEANGKTFNVTLLRPNWWILNIGADRKGNRFYLKIPEVAEGSALVTNIRANQLDTRLWNEQRDGDYVYRPITATFEHESSQVLNLYFANNKEPIGVTTEHPFYSLDRQDFVRADNLSIGEKVKTYQGQTTLLDKTKLEGTHKVYNIEVYKDHNYMVSMDSLLVHNKGGGNSDLNSSNLKTLGYNGAGKIERNALTDKEYAQAQDIIAFQGGFFKGVPTDKFPGIDGWLDGKPVQLKMLEPGGSFNTLKNAIVKGNKNLKNANYVGDIYVDATNIGLSRSQITNAINTNNGRAISNIVSEGTTENVYIKATDGWLNVTSGKIVNISTGKK